MKQVKIQPADVRAAYVKFVGGLDLTTPVLDKPPGSALDAMNYEPGLKGGYRRIDGFERVDGRPAPADATYVFFHVAFTGAVAVGNLITGSTTGATGIVCVVDTVTGYVCVTKVTGTFHVGAAITVAGVTVGTITSIPSPNGCPDAKSDATALAAAADIYRADIGAVPGTGPVRGVWMYKGVLYAWRDSGANCVMYRASTTGWQLITFGEEIAFSNANTSLVEGATLTQGSATATIARVVLETGSLASGTNTGRLILSGRGAASFASGAATATGGGTVTLGGAQTAIRFLAGGRFECINTNFTGSTATQRMYGCDGVNRAFEFDGTVMVPIRTGMANDAPKFIIEHKKKLFLAFKGSVQISGDGLPYQWTILAGANELGMGDDIVGMAVQAGDTLGIFTRNSSYQLNGSTNNTFQLLPISKEIGALPYTVQILGRTMALDDRGVIVTDRTQAYGNFIQSTISEAVQPVIDRLRTVAIGSTVYRNRAQMRIYGSDGTGVILAFNTQGLIGITQLAYPVHPTCFASCEDATGKDVVFFGADNGYVYQTDRGSSFDGAPIEAYLRMPSNTLGSPRMRKRFRKAVMSMSANAYSAIRFQPEFSDGSPDIGTHRLQVGEVIGSGGYWDISLWDQFYYDAQIVTAPEFSVEGTGLNMALLFYSNSAIDSSHILQGMTIHYSLRRLSR
jgi:hypothetical protein